MNRTYRDILDAVAADYIPSDINLLPRLVNLIPDSAHGRKKTFLQTLRSRPVVLILIVVFALALLTGMAYVVGKSMGYLPGVGLVDLSAPVRVLKEPVRVQHGGVIIVVDTVIADATRTVIQYHFDGFPFGQGDFFPIPVLRLENGKELISTGGGGLGWSSDSGRINTSSTFPPVPVDLQKVVLIFYNFDPTNKFGPTFNLEVPFSLIPAPKNFITPGVEIGVTAQESGPSFITTPNLTPGTTIEYPTSRQPTPTRMPNGTGLYLDRIIEYTDSYLLIGNFTDVGDLPGQLMPQNTSLNYLPIIFTDAKGNVISAWPRIDVIPVPQWNNSAQQWNNSFSWAYEIAKPINFPLVLRLESVDVATSESATFQFDTGANPQIGQTWKIDQHISLQGVVYTIEAVTMIKAGYSFRINHPVNHPLNDESHSLSLHILRGDDNEGGAGWSESRDHDDASITYESGHIPTGKLTVELSCDVIVPISGPWTLIWSPPGKP